MRWRGAIAATVATMTIGARAFGQGPTPSVGVDWSAPQGCPSRAAVLGEVRAILEGSEQTAHPVDARATVTRAGQRWHVDLAIRSDQGSGERSIEADSCAELASAVALIVALAVDPTRRAPPAATVAPAPPSTGEAEPPTVPPPAPATQTAPPPSPPPSPPPPASRGSAASSDGPRLAVGAAGLADLGTMPSAAVGGALSLAGLYRRTRLEARARILASQRANDAARPTQGVDLTHLGFDARACFAVVATGRAAREGVAVSPCLGVDFVRLAGTGVGGQKTLAGDGAWVAAEGGLLGTWALASILAVRVGVDLLVPTSRPAFVVLAPDGSTASSLHRAAAIGGRIDLGAELRFW